MIEARALDHDFDEEAAGFGEPPSRDAPPRPWLQRLSVGMVAIGLLIMLVQWTSGALGEGWWGLLAGLGLASLGASGVFYLGLAGTSEGIKNDGVFFGSTTGRGLIGWGLGIVLTGFYVLLYWYPQTLEKAIDTADPLARVLAGGEADQWFLYGLLYTLAILVFGVRMFMKYRHSRYQQIRTASVMFFQLGLAFLLPNLLKAFQQPEFYFTYFWPLKWSYLWPADHGIGWILDHPSVLGLYMVLFGAVMSFLATPILTYFYGKRWYCSWVCGCGGLAETLGDPFRHLSDKSPTSWRIERVSIYAVLGFVVVSTGMLWIDYAAGHPIFGSAADLAARWYAFLVGAVFAGVIGVGFYPIMGSRVWCRFGCPQAAILGIFQKLWSRFRITTNGDQCMSCGNCSTYCEMGIDVRSYAERGENIVRASCVGCGICSAVCPRGVLKLENGTTHADRFYGSDRPLDVFLTHLRSPDVPFERPRQLDPSTHAEKGS